MAQSLTGSWDQLLAVLVALFPAAVVTSGDPGEYTNDLIVTLLELRAPISQPVSSPTRPREKVAEVDVLFSAFVAGGEEAQQPANQAAWVAADAFENHFRTKPNEELNGSCRSCFVTSVHLRPYIYWVTEDNAGVPVDVAAGRVCDITSTVTIHVRT